MSKSQDYSGIAGQFQNYMQGAVTEWTLGYPAVAALLEPISGKRILDFGCGGGNFSRFLSDLGAEVIGVDASENMIACASAHDTAAKFFVLPSGGLAELPFCDFDAAVLNFVLCTMPSIEEVVQTLSQISNKLDQAGICITLNTNWERCNGSDFASFKLDLVEPLRSGDRIALYLKSEPPLRIEDYFWSQADYVSFYQEAGFADVSVQEVRPTGFDPRWIDELNTSPFFLIAGHKQY